MTNVEKILKEKAVRITPMRQLLLECFLNENKTFGLAELEKVFPKSDRITIYRTLKTFEEKGIVHGIESGNAEMKYALCKLDCLPQKHMERHPHFHCLICKQITCLEEVSIPSIELPKQYQVTELKVIIKGICENCDN